MYYRGIHNICTVDFLITVRIMFAKHFLFQIFPGLTDFSKVTLLNDGEVYLHKDTKFVFKGAINECPEIFDH